MESCVQVTPGHDATVVASCTYALGLSVEPLVEFEQRNVEQVMVLDVVSVQQEQHLLDGLHAPAVYRGEQLIYELSHCIRVFTFFPLPLHQLITQQVGPLSFRKPGLFFLASLVEQGIEQFMVAPPFHDAEDDRLQV